MVPLMILSFIIVGLVSTIRSFISMNHTRNQHFSVENVILLILIYLTVLIGFGLIYVLLSAFGYPVLLEGGFPISGSFPYKLETSMYFSAVTLLTVGYGDITPIGVGRWIAVVESLLGYSIPMAFVVRMVINVDRSQ